MSDEELNLNIAAQKLRANAVATNADQLSDEVADLSKRAEALRHRLDGMRVESQPAASARPPAARRAPGT